MVGGASLAVIGVAQIRQARKQTGVVDRQAHAAERQAAAAEAAIELSRKQLEVAELQADRERAAYLAPAHGTTTWSDAGCDQTIRLYNGGAHPATDVRAWFASADGSVKTLAAALPMIAPGQAEELRVSVARQQAYITSPPLVLNIEWRDGRGAQHAVTSLQARQEGAPMV